MSSLRSENTSNLHLYFLHLHQTRVPDNGEHCAQGKNTTFITRHQELAGCGGSPRLQEEPFAVATFALRQGQKLYIRTVQLHLRVQSAQPLYTMAVYFSGKVIYFTLRGYSARTGCLAMVVPPPMRGVDSLVLTGAHAASKRCSLEEALKGQLFAATPSADSSASMPESSVLGGVEFVFGNSTQDQPHDERASETSSSLHLGSFTLLPLTHCTQSDLCVH